MGQIAPQRWAVGFGSQPQTSTVTAVPTGHDLAVASQPDFLMSPTQEATSTTVVSATTERGTGEVVHVSPSIWIETFFGEKLDWDDFDDITEEQWKYLEEQPTTDKFVRRHFFHFFAALFEFFFDIFFQRAWNHGRAFQEILHKVSKSLMIRLFVVQRLVISIPPQRSVGVREQKLGYRVAWI